MLIFPRARFPAFFAPLLWKSREIDRCIYIYLYVYLHTLDAAFYNLCHYARHLCEQISPSADANELNSQNRNSRISRVFAQNTYRERNVWMEYSWYENEHLRRAKFVYNFHGEAKLCSVLFMNLPLRAIDLPLTRCSFCAMINLFTSPKMRTSTSVYNCTWRKRYDNWFSRRTREQLTASVFPLRRRRGECNVPAFPLRHAILRFPSSIANGREINR